MIVFGEKLVSSDHEHGFGDDLETAEKLSDSLGAVYLYLSGRVSKHDPHETTAMTEATIVSTIAPMAIHVTALMSLWLVRMEAPFARRDYRSGMRELDKTLWA